MDVGMAGRRSAAFGPAVAPPGHGPACLAPPPSDGRKRWRTPSRTADRPPSPTPSQPQPKPFCYPAFATCSSISIRAAAGVAVASSRAWLGLRIRVGLDTQIRTRPSRACPLLTSLTHFRGRRTRRQRIRVRRYVACNRVRPRVGTWRTRSVSTRSSWAGCDVAVSLAALAVRIG